MVAYQRHALFNAAVCASALIFFAALVPLLGPYRAMGGFGLLGLTGFGPFFFRKRGGKVVSDERDLLINLRATQISVAVCWLIFVGGVGLMCYINRAAGVISVNALPLMIFAGWAIFLLTHSLATLLLHRRT